MEREARQSKGKILFTGNGERMLDNLINHMPDGYEMIKCAPVDSDFLRALENFQPHLIIVCLLHETREMLHTYFVLQDKPKFANIPVIAMGQEEDCAFFKKKVFPKNLEVFVRPLDRDRFLETVGRFMALSHQLAQAQAQTQDTAPARQSADAPEADLLGEPSLAERELMAQVEQKNGLSGRKSILVVDDDVRMLNVLKLFLQDLYDVTVVPSGKLALKFLAKKKADLVLLDYLMPEMPGPEVLRQIRSGGPNAAVPVVFLTGVSDRERVMRGLELRPSGYLLKPITREDLLEKVTEIILEL